MPALEAMEKRGDLKMTVECVHSRTYHKSRLLAERQGKSPEDAKAIACVCIVTGMAFGT